VPLGSEKPVGLLVSTDSEKPPENLPHVKNSFVDMRALIGAESAFRDATKPTS
jgi:hypothetical protein